MLQWGEPSHGKKMRDGWCKLCFVKHWRPFEIKKLNTWGRTEIQRMAKVL